MTICQRLRQKRRAMKMRQVDVATYLGFDSKNGYWSIENGRTRLRVEHIVALCRLYNVPAEFFLQDDEKL